MKLFETQETVVYDSRRSEVVVRRRNSGQLKTPFSAVAPFTNSKRRSKKMNVEVFDLLDQLDRVSKGAFSVFNNLKYNRAEDTNITQYVVKESLNKTEKESLSRRIRELKNVGLICSVRKHIQLEGNKTYTFNDPRKTYIINPELLRCSNHDEAEYLWSQCAEGEEV